MGSQKSHEPHFEQKPRRTFSEDWYHVMFEPPEISGARQGSCRSVHAAEALFSVPGRDAMLTIT